MVIPVGNNNLKEQTISLAAEKSDREMNRYLRAEHDCYYVDMKWGCRCKTRNRKLSD
jgi:hypothetical protein